MKCSKCTGELTRKNKQLTCDQCKCHYHVLCTFLKESVYDAMSKAGSLNWTCESCRKSNTTLKDANTKLVNENKQLKQENKNLMSRLSTLERQLENFKKNLKKEILAEINQNQGGAINQHECGVEVRQLRKKVNRLENAADAQDQYSRKDSVILSGPSVPDMHQEENCPELVKKLLKSQLNVDINLTDISVTHRLGPITSSSNPNKRNIYVKFCRRDLARYAVAASRSKKIPTFFCSESLTPLRRNIFHSLRQLRKKHSSIIKGCTTLAGKIFAFTAPIGNSRIDQKHHIACMEDLRDFCRTHVKMDLDQAMTDAVVEETA